MARMVRVRNMPHLRFINSSLNFSISKYGNGVTSQHFLPLTFSFHFEFTIFLFDHTSHNFGFCLAPLFSVVPPYEFLMLYSFFLFPVFLLFHPPFFPFPQCSAPLHGACGTIMVNKWLCWCFWSGLCWCFFFFSQR